MSLGLQKALTPKNIQANFRTTCIQPLNKEEMVGKMGASEIIQHLIEARKDLEVNDVPSEAS